MRVTHLRRSTVVAAPRVALPVRTAGDFERKEVTMSRPFTALRSTLALATALLTAGACADQPTQPRGPVAGHGAVDAFLQLAPAYTQLDLGVARTFPASTLHLTLIAGGDIPKGPDNFINSVAAFGYAWMDLGSGAGAAAVMGAGGWNGSAMQLASGTASSTYCVSSMPAAQGGLSLHGDIMDLNLKERDIGVPATSLGMTVAFVTQSDADCGSGTGLVVLGSIATTMNSGSK